MLFPVFNIAGMMLDNFTSEHVPVDMRINFRGGDGFMSQHALNCPQIGAAFQQMGGKGMAERVRTDILGDTGLFRQFFNHVKHHDAGDTIAPSCQKYVIFVSFLDFSQVTVCKPILYFFDGAGGDRYQALFAAFAFHLDESFLEVKVGDFQVTQFRHA